MLDLSEVEILQVALAHEDRARAFYERMADRHGDSTAGDLFGFLSREEMAHIAKLSDRHGIPEFQKDWQEKYIPYLIDLERLALDEGVEAQYSTGPEAVRAGLGIAKKAEAHAIAFFAQAERSVEDPKTRSLLAELELEERTHLARIEGFLADLPPAPR